VLSAVQNLFSRKKLLNPGRISSSVKNHPGRGMRGRGEEKGEGEEKEGGGKRGGERWREGTLKEKGKEGGEEITTVTDGRGGGRMEEGEAGRREERQGEEEGHVGRGEAW
jgi:hypothetical protein